jgi:hypothetical protein
MNPKQMSIGNSQIPAGSFNPDDKFGFGFRRFDDQKRSINKNSVFHMYMYLICIFVIY